VICKLGVCQLQVRNPDPADFSIFSRWRFRNQDKASEGQREECTCVSMAAVNRPWSADECRRERRGEECARVYVLVDDQLSTCAGIREHTRPTTAGHVRVCRTQVSKRSVERSSNN